MREEKGKEKETRLGRTKNKDPSNNPNLLRLRLPLGTPIQQSPPTYPDATMGFWADPKHCIPCQKQKAPETKAKTFKPQESRKLRIGKRMHQARKTSSGHLSPKALARC